MDRAVRSESAFGDYVERARQQRVLQEDDESRAAYCYLQPRPDGLTVEQHMALEVSCAQRKTRNDEKRTRRNLRFINSHTAIMERAAYRRAESELRVITVLTNA